MGQANYPSHVSNALNRWLEGGENNERQLLNRKLLQQANTDFELYTEEDKEYAFEMIFKKIDRMYHAVKPKFAELDKRDNTKAKNLYLTSPMLIYTLIIKSFYGNTLELDPTYTAENPFRKKLLKDGKTSGSEARYKKETLTLYDILKKVTEAPAHNDQLSIVVIGNYSNIIFGTDYVYRTEKDKIEHRPMSISAHDFMQQRAFVFRDEFLSGLSCSITAIAADDPLNTYKDNLYHLGDKNPLSPSHKYE